MIARIHGQRKWSQKRRSVWSTEGARHRLNDALEPESRVSSCSTRADRRLVAAGSVGGRCSTMAITVGDETPGADPYAGASGSATRQCLGRW